MPSLRPQRLSSTLLLLLALGWLPGACAEAPLPGLPGVAPGEQEWFWRDVLAAPLSDEPAPRLELLNQPARAAVEALSELSNARDPAAVTTLLAALGDERDGVAIVAAELLGTLGDRRALPRLLKGLGPYPVDYDPAITRRAAQASALARLGHPAGLPLLLDLLSEGTAVEAPRASLPWSATTQIVYIQELALVGLEALAGDDFGFEPNASVPAREAAARAARAWAAEHSRRLWQTAPSLDADGLKTRVRLLVAHLDAYQLRQVDGARYTLSQLGPPVLAALAEGLASESPYQRVHGLQVLERLAGRADTKTDKRLGAMASAHLLDAVDSSEAAAAAQVCGAVGFAEPLLVALRRRSEPDVRVAVVDALGLCPAEVVLPTLSVLAETEVDPDTRAALVFARWRLDTSLPDSVILDLLTESPPELAAPALDRLSRWSGVDPDFDAFASTEARRAARPQLLEALNQLER